MEESRVGCCRMDVEKQPGTEDVEKSNPGGVSAWAQATVPHLHHIALHAPIHECVAQYRQLHPFSIAGRLMHSVGAGVGVHF